MLDMKRREFIALVGGGGQLLAAEVRRARAQQPMPVGGVLSAEWPNQFADRLHAFHEGLRETGRRRWPTRTAQRDASQGKNQREVRPRFSRLIDPSLGCLRGRAAGHPQRLLEIEVMKEVAAKNWCRAPVSPQTAE